MPIRAIRLPSALEEIQPVLRPGGTFVCESRFAQRLAHPVRGGHELPWSAAGSLNLQRRAGLWSASVKRKAERQPHAVR